MEEMSKHGHIGVAAMKADMDRKTARKYVAAGELPSEMVVERSWRTRVDPFVDVWPEVEQMLVDAPGLEAKTVFDALQRKYPDRFVDGQQRSLQRKVQSIRSLDRVGTRGRRPRRCPPTRWSMANETEWAERVRQAEASGLSIPAFAAKHRLSKSALYNWRRRLATQAAGSAEASSSPSALRALAFVRLEPLSHQPVAEPIEVLLRNGRVVRVPLAFGDDALARVLDVAERGER